MKPLLLLSLALLSSSAQAAVLLRSTYSCMAADGTKATYEFKVTDEVSDGLWGQQNHRDYHFVNGAPKALASEIKIYGVHISSSTSVLDVLSSLDRPLNNDNRRYQGIILVSVRTNKAFACAQGGGDF